jgi:hypothetical protein
MEKDGGGLWMTRSVLATLAVRLPQGCSGENGQSEKLSVSYQYHINIHIELYLGHYPYGLRSNQLLSGRQCKVFGYQLAKPLMLRVDRKKMNAASWREHALEGVLWSGKWKLEPLLILKNWSAPSA